MFDPNFDPYQELIDCRIEIEQLKINQLKTAHAHNRLQDNFVRLHNEVQKLRQWQISFQIELAQLQDRLDKNNCD